MKLFFLQLWGELVKMSARKRTYIGFAAFLAVELAIFFMLRTERGQREMTSLMADNGLDVSEYFSWLTVGQSIRNWTMFILGGIYLSLILGDIVAKETEEGSFRLLMSRPISRLRLLTLKYCAGLIYTFFLVLFVTVTAFLVGLIQFGPKGGLLVYQPFFGTPTFAYMEGAAAAKKLLINLPLLTVSVSTVSALAFMFSCFKMKPATAAILGVSVVMVDFLLSQLPIAGSYQPYSLINRMSCHFQVYRPQIPWEKLAIDYSYLLAIQATAFVVGWFAFQIRDFKS
jgi:ABC-2 type transport system permease protein